ncbi:toll/interleukin-1 receptor domain-containing protein [Geodermatophilus sp. SYSU D01176]
MKEKPIAFLSYVRDDASLVDRLEADLELASITVWRDSNWLEPGDRWKQKIREAISTRAVGIVACFSEASEQKDRTYMREEILLAVEEMRQRPRDWRWFIPVKLTPCKIPDLSIGAGETLEDIHYVALYEDWAQGVSKIAKVIWTEAERRGSAF